MRTPRHGLLALIVVLACRGLPLPALSQTPSSPPSPAQLETLVAPIALYPDALVAQILPASTNPLQVVEAARALADGRRPDEAEASQWGYYFRILTAQGPAAPGGARSYVKDGAMTGGFALVANPVSYGSTGIMKFLVGKDGLVYERDLGKRTDQIVEGMNAYDSDGGWKPVSE